MAYEEETPQKITGKTFEECRIKLYEKYQKDFKIVDKYQDFKYGPLHLRKKPVCVVRYVVIHQNAYTEMPIKKTDEELQLELNRQQILNQQNNLLVTTQINHKIDEKFDDFAAQIISKMNELPTAVSKKHESVQKIEEILTENEFSYSYIQMIVEKIDATFPKNQLDDFKLVQRYVVDWIGETISVTKDKVFRAPHVYVLVGPTGVGKTTTLTKLMAQSFLLAKQNDQPSPNGCFITIDNIRAGAYEQLKKLGETVGYPVIKAKTSDDVKTIYDDYRAHVDNIFVDTAGCSPNDAEHLGAMQTVLDVNINPDVYLTVTASTKASDLSYIFRNYEPFGYNNVIITKIDESRQIGNVISVLWDKHKSIAYLADGQHPKDIKRATVIELLKRLSGFEIDRVHLENKFGASEYAD